MPSQVPFDIAIIGAGAVGSAIARELSKYQLKIALLESNPDVGMGTSKASTAIWHTGYDAKPKTLESTLLKRSYPLMERYMAEANIAHEKIGGLMIAWNQEQLDSLPVLLEQAHANGDTDVKIISAGEVYQREPNLGKGALGGLFIPGEGILCTFSIPLAFAYQAVENGVELFLNFRVAGIDVSREDRVGLLDQRGNAIYARYIVNAAGLFSDEVDAFFGKTNFIVRPRLGQLIIFDKLARNLVNHVLLPVPTSITKGVLISPTVYGNILLGPNAENLEDKSATETTADGLQMLLDKGKYILPQLLGEEITATYSGLRAATEFSDYQIEMDNARRLLTLGGIRSTGISGAMGIAEYGVELLGQAGLTLQLKKEFKTIKLPTIGQSFARPHQSVEMVAQNPSYAEIICHCEKVSRAELQDAMNAPIPAMTLDGLRRRTRASQGRCQGFNCHAKLQTLLSSSKLLDLSNARAGSRPQDQAVATQSAIQKDVLIVGAGPAGLSAAIELKKRGIKDVLVIDREPEAGGMPRFCHHTGFGREDLWRMWQGPKYARYYRELADKHGVDVRVSTTILNWAGEKKLAFTSPDGIGEIEADAVLLATGVRERPRSARLIPGTRPQGIYTTGSLQRFVYQEKLPIGKRAIIIGAELVSLSALMTLMHAKVECAMMVTEEARHTIQFPYIGMKWLLADLITRTPIVTHARVTNIFGKQKLEGLEITHNSGRVELVECDAAIFTGNWIPENELARLGGLQMDSITKGPVINAAFESSVYGVFVAGNLLRGVETADRCAVEGKRAADSIARYLK